MVWEEKVLGFLGQELVDNQIQIVEKLELKFEQFEVGRLEVGKFEQLGL